MTTNGLVLHGVSVLITRPAYAAGRLAQQITELGGTPLRQPGLTIEAIADDEPSLGHLQHSHQTDFAIFTSRPAVSFGLQRMRSRSFASHCRILAIGAGTAQALREAGINNVAMPATASSEAMLEMAELQEVTAKRVLVFCARGGRIVLEQGLLSRGAVVDPVYVYQRGSATVDPAVLQAVQEDFDRIIVTASSVTMLENLLAMYSKKLPGPLRDRPLAVIGPRIADGARDAGFRNVQSASDTTDTALLQTVSMLAQQMKAEPE